MSQQLSRSRLPRLFRLAGSLLVFLLLLGGGTGWSHNLDMQINYLIFDQQTTQMVQNRAAAGQPLMQAGDTVGIILKATPNKGTKTGAGGYSTFYVPVGTQVMGAEYGVLQNGGTFQPLPMKGQSILTHGRDPVDPGAPDELRGYVIGPNILGVSAQMAEATSAGFCWGTLAGLYGDTGIFYSTDPATAWQSWTSSGGLDGNPATNDIVLRNNKGDYVTPTTLWDAHQLLAFGVKSPVSPIMDRNGRGSTPWGTGTPVAGPESGYAWSFNKSYWDANPTNPNRLRNAIQVGPWKRIRYAGSEAAKDTPGRRSTALDLVGVDASGFGFSLSPSSPLPPTVSWTDSSSPKALRFSWGGLELYRPEYCRIFVKILKNPGESGAPFDSNGYLQLFGEAFGGDAGGEYGNKDHLWRYYKPSIIGLNASPMIEVVASKKIVLPNELFHFDIRVTNMGNLPMTNTVIENPLPAALTFVSSIPAQSAGPSALRWNIGTLPPQSVRTIRLNVRPNATGLITNTASVRSVEFPTPREASDTVTSDFIAIMYGDKSVSPSNAEPGGKVVYKIVVRNDGACPNRAPWKVREFLPDGFKFTRMVDQFINGARTSTSVISASSSNLNRPEFNITRALEVGKTLEILFEAELSPTQAPGQYFNRYAVDYDDKVYVTGLIAPVTVGGGKVGDLVFQDWNANGLQDSGEPGLAGVELQLWTDPNGDGDPADGILRRTTTTNAQGAYDFGGTSPGNYVVKVSGGVPADYDLTADPEGPLNGMAKLAITDSSDRLDVDFGYQPLGSLAVSGLVFSDLVNDGVFQPAKDTPIPGVGVSIFFDANGNGIVDAADILVASATSASGGAYAFSNLAANLPYVVKVNAASPALPTFFEPNSFKSSSPAEIALGALTANVADRNFGFFANLPGSIGDQVFQDLNRNGVFDSGDLVVPNVTVSLHRDANNNKLPDPGEFVRDTSTDSRGRYLFSDLGEGDYVVQLDLTDPDLPGGVALSPPHLPVTVLPAENRLDIDFPLKRVLSLQVSPEGSAAPGSRLTYSIRANYPQVTQFSNVTVSNILPPGTTLAPGSISNGGVFGSNTVSWNLGTTTGPVQNTHVPVINCVRNIRLEEPSTIEDTYINAASTSTNYADTTLRFRPANTSSQRHSLMKFSMAQIPPGATIRSVSIGLRVSATRTNQTITAYPLNTHWVESVATWADPNGVASGRWGAGGANFDAADFDTSRPLGSLVPNTVGYKIISSANLRALVQSWVSDPASNRGIALVASGSDTGESVIFNSESTVNNVPYMDIEYEYIAPDSCEVDSHGVAYWARDNLLNGKYAAWNGGNFDTATLTPPLTADFDFVVGASSAKRDEKIIAGIMERAENNIAGQMWDGTGWTNLPMNPLGKATSTSDVGVAVQYEEASGDAVLVWADAYQPNGLKLRFSVWNGSAWTPPASITSYTGAEPSNMKLVVKPGADEMMLVINDYEYDDHVIVWNGSSWGPSLLLESAPADANNIHDIAVAYEPLSGRGMVIYGRDNRRDVYYRFWNGSSWSSQQTLSGPGSLGDTRYITAASDPGGNRIAIGVVSDGSDAWFSVWNGSSWSTPFVAEYSLNTQDAPTVAVAFESQSGDLLTAYSERNHTGVKFRTWSAASGWSAEGSAIPLGNEANTVILQPDLNTNEIMLLAQDDNLDLVVTRWTGENWKGYRELEDNTGENAKQPFTYLWDIYRRNPNPPLTTAEGLVGPASIINDGQIVSVSTTLTASRNIDGIVAPDPAFVVTSGSGLTATKLSGPTPGASTVGQRGLTYTWSYRINGGASPSSGLFRWNAFTVGDATFPGTDSNSFLYAPTLSFQVDIDAPPPNPVVQNQASIELGFGPVPSNRVETPLFASIGDLVWADYNRDGLRDTDEPGLAGVRVFIDANANGLFDPGEREGSSNAEGFYLITGVGAGTHQVVVDVNTTPADFAASTPTALIRTLAASQSSFTCDFGFYPRPDISASSSISGLVWHDADANGLVGDYEAPLPGVLVRLFRDTDNDSLLGSADFLVATSNTAADGSFIFPQLEAGSYLVRSDASSLPGMVLVSGHSPLNNAVPVSLDPAEANSDPRFGYNHTASIAGLVFYDLNANGVRNPHGLDGQPGTADDEIGAADATVHLVLDENANGVADPLEPVQAFGSTNASGFYLFSNLPPGAYVAKIEDQSVVAPPGSDNAGLVGFMLPTTDEQVPLSLSPGQSLAGADFGLTEKAVLQGYVFHDQDSSTLRDPDEAGLPNVAVRILGLDIRGDSVDLTVTSDADGLYTLLVAPGTYTLTYSSSDPAIPAGLVRATTPVSYNLDLLPGVERSDFDFGRDHDGVLGGRVFNDDDGSGLQNLGEDGIPDVTIQLFDAGGSTLLFTTTTDMRGDYRFTGLPDGQFTVAVLASSLPPGYGATPTADPDTVLDGRSRPLVAGATPNLTQIFGYRHLGTTHTLGGLIFDDSGAGGGVFSNGVRDGAEPGMAAVSLRMNIDFDKDGSFDEYRVVTTDASGAFSSNGVPSGANVELFVMSRTLPRRAYAPTADPNGAVDGRASFPGVAANVGGLLFGFSLQPSTISGSVVLGDGNGRADPGEQPMSGVIVRLTYAGYDDVIGTSDDLSFTRSTDASGAYSIDNLDPGVFQVVQSVPYGFKARADADGGNPSNISLDIAPGGLASGRDFENYELPQIRGRVLVDADRSGDISQDDTPVAGVTVRLFSDLNSNGVRDPEDVQINTFVTDALGVYRFGPIADPAEFLVMHDLPDTMISITDADGPANGINFIAVSVGELDVNNRDFLNRPIPMTLGGRVFNDHNSNALLDSTESGLSGIQVRLFDSSTSLQIGASTTAADGRYSFPGLWPGTYFVQITPPASHPASGGAPVALDNDQPGDNNGLQPGGPGTTVSSPPIVMAVNTESAVDGDTDVNTNLTVDLGLWTGITLGNLVWNDSSNNGLKGSTESGISGLAVHLFRPGSDDAFGGSGDAADTLVESTTTNSSGLYSFRVFTPGRYYVRLTPPSTRPLTSSVVVNLDNGVNDDNNGIQLGSAGNDVITPVVLLTAGGEPGSSGNSNLEDTLDIGLRACPAVTISPTSVLAGTVYGAYTQALAATGGVAPRTFRVSLGTLPNGLSLSSGGVISGTINDVPGNYWFRVEARDNQGCVGTRDYTLNVTCPNPVVGPVGNVMPEAWHWQSYSQTFTATGVAASYTWSRSSGSFPAGLSLNPLSGTLSGTVTGSPGIYSFTIRAIDPMGYCVTDKSYTLEVRAYWDYGDLADSAPDTGFSGGATADHRTTFSDNGPRHSIRPGLHLGASIDNETDGQPGALADLDGSDEDGLVIPSTFVAGSSSTATISLTNTLGITARANLWIDWNGNGSFEDSGERWVNNASFTTTPRSFTVTVPVGAVLNRPVGVRVRLSSSSLSSSLGAANDGEVEDYLVTVVCPTLSITTPNLPTWYLGAPNSQTFSATGGTAPYTWTLDSGSLPPGLSLSSAGTLSGTPSAVGSYSFTLRATDAYGCSVTRSYSSFIKGLSLGNLVFNDTDDNGVRSPWELGVSGVLVELFHPGADNAVGGSGSNADTLVASRVTDSMGFYRFDDIPVGRAFLRVTPPASLRVTGGSPVSLDNGINDDNNGSQPGGPGTPLFSPVVSLNPGLESIADGDNDPDTDLTLDFGVWSGVGIGSTIFSDANSDGRLNPDENGFASVRVELWRDVDNDVANGAEVFVTHALTDVAGHFTFLGYPSGRYQIVIPNSNFEAGAPLNASPFASPVRAYADDQVDDDSNAIQLLGGGTEARSPLVNLVAGDEPVGSGLGGVSGEFGRGGDLDDSIPDENADMTVDMGFVAPGTIGLGNLVFVDENDNGRADPGEGVNGVTVQLFYTGDNPLTDPPLLSTTTANDGRYLFSIVWEGNFFVHLPARQFIPGGVLHTTYPLTSIVPGDDDVGQDAIASSQPWITGVSSQPISLIYGSAPTAATGETGTDASSDDLMDDASDLTIDIGLFRSGGIGNLVFFDANENGRADSGEGVDGVTVELYRDPLVPGFDTPTKTTVTSDGGRYFFDLVSRGNYRVHIPADQFLPGAPLYRGVSIAEGLSGDDDVGEDGINVVDPTLTGVSSRRITLFPGTAPTGAEGETGFESSSDNEFDSSIDLTIDFGFQNPVGLGNLVFVDYNDNGIADADEGVGGVRVELYRASQTPGQDVPVFTQLTSADGHYFFGSLSSGDYRVHIPASQFRPGAALSGLTPLALDAYGDDNLGQDGFSSGAPALDGVSTDVVSLATGSAPMNFGTESGFNYTEDDLYDNNFDLTIDFGFGPPANNTVGVGNLVYQDLNGNQKFDSGEGVPGVSVFLFSAGADPLTASPVNATVTDLNGYYLFTGLPEGDYFLHIPASQFAAGGPLADLFSLPGHGQDTGADDDIDENGIDSATPSVSGVSSVPFSLALGTEPTNDTSEYGAGTYLDNLADSNHDLTFDFGFYESVGLGNLVFLDSDGNGRADTDEGVPGIRVELYDSEALPGWSPPVATTTTDSFGRYAFSSLRPGFYILHIPYSEFVEGAPLAGLLSLPGVASGDDDTGEDGIDQSRPDWYGVSTGILTLTPGQAPQGAQESGLFGSDDDLNDAQFDFTIDFGFAPKLSVGNLVFSDLDGNGRFNPASESGIEGVAVELWHQDFPDGPVATTETDVDGLYQFDVAPGTYLVRIPASEFQAGAPLAYMESSKNTQDSQPTTDGDDDLGEDGIDFGNPVADGVATPWFNLFPGGAPTTATGETGHLSSLDDSDDAMSDLTVDLGFTKKPLGVGNLVFRDLNTDGRFAAGVDEPVAGVPLRLFRVGDNPLTATPVDAAISGANGSYLLKTPAEGLYYVHVPPAAFGPNGVLFGATSVPGFGDDDGTDDDVNEDGIDAPNPASSGLNSIPFSLAYGLEPLSAPNSPGSETGAFAASDADTDAITDLSIDFGFVGGTAGNRVAVGNLVYRDANNNGSYDAGEGVDGVWMILQDANAASGSFSHLASTYTANGGRYFFGNLPAGQYIVHVAADNFKSYISIGGATPGPGPLYGQISVAGSSPGDDNLGEDGIDSAHPALVGVSSGVITLAPGSAPLVSGVESGEFLDMNDQFGDASTDLTIDFGFVSAPPGSPAAARETNTLALGGAPGSDLDSESADSALPSAPETYLEWQSRHELGQLAAPSDDADNDGLANLLEYALGLDPLSGLAQSPALSLTSSPAGMVIAYSRPATGLQDARYELQVRPDLSSSAWQTLAAPSSSENLPDGSKTLRFTPPAGWSQGFVRLGVMLDSDGNGSPEAQSFSPAHAWLAVSLATGQQTLAQPLLKDALFSGTVQPAGEASVSLSLPSGSDIAASLAPGAQYYLELASGPAAGHRFEINEAASQGALLALDLSSSFGTSGALPAGLAGARAHLRAHWSLADLLPVSLFTAADSPDQSDRALFFDRASNQFQTRWLRAGDPAVWTSDTAAPDFLAPGSALLAHRRGSPVSLLWTGVVRDHAFQLPLLPGTQLAAAGFPLPHSPASLQLTTASGLVAGASPSSSDRFRLWRGDSLQGSTGYSSFFLLQSADSARWVNQEDATFQDVSGSPLLPSTRGLFIQRLPGAAPLLLTQEPPPSQP